MLRQSIAAAAMLTMVLAGGIAPANAQETLKVGIWNQNPFGGDPPGGFCHDLLEAIAEITGLTFEYLPTADWRGTFDRVGAGELDLQCTAGGATDERRALGLAFAGPTMSNFNTVIVRADEDTRAATLSELAAAGKRIGTNDNPTRLGLLDAAEVDYAVFPTAPDVRAAILAGELDAWLVNGAEALIFVSEEPRLRIVDTFATLGTSYGMIAVASDNHLLLGTIQSALDAVKLDGVLAEIAARWGVPLPPF
jgi:ABC-type amino acid transport substrate-binding protein